MRAEWTRGGLSALVFVALLGTTSAAHAQEPRSPAVRISESLHPGCPSKPSLRERLEAELGHVREARPDEAAAIDLTFRIAQQGAVSKGTLMLVVGGVSVERTASSRSCEDVLAALAMMAAIAIGEEGARSSSRASEGARDVTPASPRSSNSPLLPRVAPPSRRTPPVLAASSPRAKAIAFGLGTSVEINGNRGSGVVAATWFGQLTFPRTRFEPTLRAGFRRSSQESIAAQRGSLGVRWSELALAACADVVRERLIRLGPCFDTEVGSLEVNVDAPPPVRRYSYFWLTLGASGRIGWRLLPALSVEAAVGARLPIVRTGLFFEQDPAQLTYQVSRIVPFAAVSFIAYLP